MVAKINMEQATNQTRHRHRNGRVWPGGSGFALNVSLNRSRSSTNQRVRHATELPRGSRQISASRVFIDPTGDTRCSQSATRNARAPAEPPTKRHLPTRARGWLVTLNELDEHPETTASSVERVSDHIRPGRIAGRPLAPVPEREHETPRKGKSMGYGTVAAGAAGRARGRQDPICHRVVARGRRRARHVCFDVTFQTAANKPVIEAVKLQVELGSGRRQAGFRSEPLHRPWCGGCADGHGSLISCASSGG